MKYIDEVTIVGKTILVRVDFNVPLKPDLSIADDERIEQSIPTLVYLLKQQHKLILIAHLGDPETRSPDSSLTNVAKKLQTFLPDYKVILVDDILSNREQVTIQKDNEILLLENIRFYPGEKKNDPEFSKQLASLGDVYVNDAFSVSHREAASIVGLPALLPSYGGLLLKKEVTHLEKIINDPKKPLVAIIGGKKIATKIKFIAKLTELADYVLLGGGLANTFFAARGYALGKSLVSTDDIPLAKEILLLAEQKQTKLLLPLDAVVAKELDSQQGEVKKIDAIGEDDQILDIGPETEAAFEAAVAQAQTIVWNGPVGYMENPIFKKGSDAIYNAIITNEQAVSVVGGGDTIAAIADKENKDKISHISMGGGAMLEMVENGTLPGIEALKKNI